jgi:hypothetical protein
MPAVEGPAERLRPLWREKWSSDLPVKWLQSTVHFLDTVVHHEH